MLNVNIIKYSVLRFATDGPSPAPESATLLTSAEFRGDSRGEDSLAVWVAKAKTGSREIPRDALVESLRLPLGELAGEPSSSSSLGGCPRGGGELPTSGIELFKRSKGMGTFDKLIAVERLSGLSLKQASVNVEF